MKAGAAGIVVNGEKDPGFQYANAVADFLRGRGLEVCLESCAKRGAREQRPCELTGACDFWVVLGGDGTMLRAAPHAAIRGIPMLGINLGNLGFLTDADKNQGLAALEKLIAGQYFCEKRLMLEAEFGGRERTPLHERLALNEVCVGAAGKLAEFSV